MDVFLFYVAALFTLVGAVMVLVLPNPLRAAMSMILSLGSLAVVFVLLHAQFAAAMQLLVYAGAIIVLFVFVIMLLNLENPGHTRGTIWVGATTVVVGALSWAAAHAMQVGSIRFSTLPDVAPVRALPKDFGSVELVGTQILGDFVLPFEMLSVLLLVAVVGAVVISKKRL